MKGTIKSYGHFKFVMNSGEKTVFSHSVVYSVPYQKFYGKFRSYVQENGVYGIMVTKKNGKCSSEEFNEEAYSCGFSEDGFTKFCNGYCCEKFFGESKN